MAFSQFNYYNNTKKNNLILINIFFFFILALSYFVSDNFLPSEDAAILYRYSQNFSETGIISYNYNSTPVEGATDFLWMIILSFFNFINIDIYFSALVINFLSLLLICNLYKNYFDLENKYIFLIFFLHLSFPFAWASLDGFSVLFFELFFVLVFFFYLKKKNITLIYFSLFGCLVRPDFILFIFIPCLIALVSQKNNKKFIINFIFIFFLGLSYFIFRYIYFDNLLPLPFYVKNTWVLFQNKEFVRMIIYMSPLYFFIFFFVKPKLHFFKKYLLTMIIFILIPTLYYSSQTLYQNLGYRFYFYFAPYTIMIIFLSVKDNAKLKKYIALFFFLTFINSTLLHIIFSDYRPLIFTKKSPIYNLATELNKNFNNLKIATTEAGLLPYYSKQTFIDLWGLNTKEFSRNPAGGKFIMDNYFDMIVINSAQHGNDCKAIEKFFETSNQLNPTNTVLRKLGWIGMVNNLFSGIGNNYEIYIFPYVQHLNRNIFLFVNKDSIHFGKIKMVVEKYSINRCEKK